jgi:hypothetical protein
MQESAEIETALKLLAPTQPTLVKMDFVTENSIVFAASSNLRSSEITVLWPDHHPLTAPTTSALILSCQQCAVFLVLANSSILTNHVKLARDPTSNITITNPAVKFLDLAQPTSYAQMVSVFSKPPAQVWLAQHMLNAITDCVFLSLIIVWTRRNVPLGLTAKPTDVWLFLTLAPVSPAMRVLSVKLVNALIFVLILPAVSDGNVNLASAIPSLDSVPMIQVVAVVRNASTTSVTPLLLHQLLIHPNPPHQILNPPSSILPNQIPNQSLNQNPSHAAMATRTEVTMVDTMVDTTGEITTGMTGGVTKVGYLTVGQA